MKPNPIQDPNEHKVAELLRDWEQGNEDAQNELYELFYPELRRMAHRYMSRENPGQTLQTTALVNEAYLKVAEGKNLHFQDRAHFLAVSARIMRHILVDRARSKRAEMNGGDLNRIPMEDATNFAGVQNVDYLDLDEALKKLAVTDPRKSRIVELKHFGGLSNEEMAAVLKVSEDTIMRDWRFAKAWLKSELIGDNSHESANRNFHAVAA